jgi:hypothetical protein
MEQQNRAPAHKARSRHPKVRGRAEAPPTREMQYAIKRLMPKQQDTLYSSLLIEIMGEVDRGSLNALDPEPPIPVRVLRESASTRIGQLPGLQSNSGCVPWPASFAFTHPRVLSSLLFLSPRLPTRQAPRPPLKLTSVRSHGSVGSCFLRSTTPAGTSPRSFGSRSLLISIKESIPSGVGARLPASVLHIIAAYCVCDKKGVFRVSSDTFPVTFAKMCDGGLDDKNGGRDGARAMQSNMFESPIPSTPTSPGSPVSRSVESSDSDW